MPSVTPLSFKASFTAKGMTLVIPPGWFKPTEGKTEKTNEDWRIADLRNHGITEQLRFMVHDSWLMTGSRLMVEAFGRLMALMEEYKRKNQYE